MFRERDLEEGEGKVVAAVGFRDEDEKTEGRRMWWFQRWRLLRTMNRPRRAADVRRCTKVGKLLLVPMNSKSRETSSKWVNLRLRYFL